MNDRDIVEVIADQIIKASEKKSSNSSFDKTYVGTIIKVSSAKKYTIKYDNSDREFTTKNPLSFAIGDKVHIVYPENDSSKKYMVEDVVGSSSSPSVSGVSSVDGQTGVVSLTNSYASKSSEHTHSNISDLDNISSLKISNWDSAYSHSTSAHAPSDAEKNIIVGIQKNGTDVSVNSSTRKVNISVPTKVSELTNDSGFKTTDNNTTYEISKTDNTISLTGSDGVVTSVDATYDDGITEEMIIKMWNDIVGEPGVLESSIVIGEEPTYKNKNMVWIEM